MKVCIDTRFILGARDPNHDSIVLDQFVRILAQNHNLCTGEDYPLMSGNLRNDAEDDDYFDWPYLE
jgi:hypothetical protein